MKITIPVSYLDRSGGIRVLTILANGLVQRNYDVSFIVPRGKNLPCFPLDDRVKLQIIEPDLGQVKHLSGLLKKVQLIYGMLSPGDTAIANAFMTAYPVLFSSLFGRIKHGVYFVQGYEPFAFGDLAQGSLLIKFLKKKLADYTYHLPFTYVVNSNWLAQIFASQYDVNAIVAPLGVNTNIFYPEPDRSFNTQCRKRVFTIGSINPVKRFGLFINVMEMLEKELDCEAIVATEFQHLTAPDHIACRFIYPQNDLELAKIYRHSNIFLSTSVNEGFGLPLLEAMASGIPVVSTDSGGIRDFCSDGYNCIIVPSGDPKDLMQAILYIFSNPDLQQRLIFNGLCTAADRPWNLLIDTFDELLQTLQ